MDKDFNLFYTVTNFKEIVTNKLLRLSWFAFMHTNEAQRIVRDTIKEISKR